MNWQHMFILLSIFTGTASIMLFIEGNHEKIATLVFILATISACLAGGLTK